MQTVTDLSINIAGLNFPSPILNASGAFNASLFNRLFPLGEVMGGIVTKTVTSNPWEGNPQHRTVELPGVGMLNSIGLQNPGLDYFLGEEAAVFKTYGLPLILSISASSSSEFAEMATRVVNHTNGHHVDALEVNLSCPNVEKGGVHFGSSCEAVKEAIGAVKDHFGKPVFAKLTPNVTDIVSIGGSAVEGGADGLTAINTVLGAAIDIKKRKPILKRVSGGYSGPGIKPIAVHAIWQLHRNFPQTPILGVGGVMNAEDVIEFMMAGASVVQVGTSCFRDPLVFKKIATELQEFMVAEQIPDLKSLIGCGHQ